MSMYTLDTDQISLARTALVSYIETLKDSRNRANALGMPVRQAALVEHSLTTEIGETETLLDALRNATINVGVRGTVPPAPTGR